MLTEYPVKNNGAVNPLTALVTVQRQEQTYSSDRLALERYIISVESIYAAAQLIPIHNANEFILNTHMDLSIYNDIY